MIVDVLGISGSAMAMARRFDRSVSWVSRRLALVEQLPETVQQQVRSGEISAHAAMKYLAPVARANLKDCQRMADVFAGQVTLLSKATDLTLFMRHGLAGHRRAPCRRHAPPFELPTLSLSAGAIQL